MWTTPTPVSENFSFRYFADKKLKGHCVFWKILNSELVRRMQLCVLYAIFILSQYLTYEIMSVLVYKNLSPVLHTT